MKSDTYKNLASRAIHLLWLFAVAMALAIHPPSAQAQSYKVLYSFTKDSAAGRIRRHPWSGTLKAICTESRLEGPSAKE